MNKKILVELTSQHYTELKLLKDLGHWKSINKTINRIIELLLDIYIEQSTDYKKTIGDVNTLKPKNYEQDLIQSLLFFHRHADKYIYEKMVDNFLKISYELQIDIDRYSLK